MSLFGCARSGATLFALEATNSGTSPLIKSSTKVISSSTACTALRFEVSLAVLDLFQTDSSMSLQSLIRLSTLVIVSRTAHFSLLPLVMRRAYMTASIFLQGVPCSDPVIPAFDSVGPETLVVAKAFTCSDMLPSACGAAQSSLVSFTSDEVHLRTAPTSQSCTCIELPSPISNSAHMDISSFTKSKGHISIPVPIFSAAHCGLIMLVLDHVQLGSMPSLHGCL